MNELLGRHSICLGLILGVFLALHLPFFLQGVLPLSHDSINWFPLYNYYGDALLEGTFPYWDPYSLSGTAFYPLIPLLGFLDPLVLISLLPQKLFGVSSYNGYIMMFGLRIATGAAGVYFLAWFMTRCRVSSFTAALIFLLAILPSSYRQNGGINAMFLAPWALLAFLAFLKHLGEKKAYFFLALFAILAGWIGNIYIPAYFLYFFLVFLISLMLFGELPIKKATSFLKEGKNILSIAFLFVLLLLFMAPMLSLYLVDFSSSGEVFPSFRMVTKIDGFRQLLVSQTDLNTMDAEVYGHWGVYNTPGNLLNIVYPELATTFHDYWQHQEAYVVVNNLGDLLAAHQANIPSGKSLIYFPAIPSEMINFMGTISIFFILYGVLFGKNRYIKPCIFTAVLIFLIGFSFTGTVDQPNFLQKGLSLIFPFLDMLDVRQNFISYWLLLLSLMTAIGMQEMQDNPYPIKKHFSTIVAGVFTFLTGKALLAYLLFPALLEKAFTSVSGLLGYVLPLMFIGILFLFQKDRIRPHVMLLLAIASILLELTAVFLTASPQNQDIAKTKLVVNAVNAQGQKGKALWENYRKPLLQNQFIPYSTLLYRREQAFPFVQTNLFTDHMFMMKRYYDYFSYLPLESQMKTSGVTTPILKVVFMKNAEFIESSEDILKRMKQGTSLRLLLEKEAKSVEKYLTFPREAEKLPLVEGIRYYELLKTYDKVVESQGGFFEVSNPRVQIRVRRMSQNQIVVLVDTPEKGYLLYRDNWSRHWRAQVGASHVPIYRGDYTFKAIPLEAGEQQILLTFDPKHYRFSLYGYLFAWTAGTIALAWLFWRRKASGHAKHEL